MAVNSRNGCWQNVRDESSLYVGLYQRDLSEHAFPGEDSAFIEKPFSHDALSRKVRHALDPRAPS